MAKIYPNTDAATPFNITKRFVAPVGAVTRVFLANVPEGYHWVLEEEVSDGASCGEQLLWYAVDGPCCCQAGPCVDATSYDVVIPGSYRLVAVKCDGSPAEAIDLAGAVLITREIPDPNGAIAAKVLSEAEMACCPEKVTVTDLGNQVVITVDGVPTSIPKFVDCEGDALNPGAELATCSDLPHIEITETDNQIVVNLDDVLTSIPKFVDCEGNPMNPGENLVRCEDLYGLVCSQISSFTESARIGG